MLTKGVPAFKIFRLSVSCFLFFEHFFFHRGGLAFFDSFRTFRDKQNSSAELEIIAIYCVKTQNTPYFNTIY